MKKIIVFLMFILAAGFAFAQSAETEQPQTPQEPSTSTTTIHTGSSMSGTVDSIDMATKTITIRDENGKTVSYTFNTDTTFTRQDQPFTITELKSGDRVTYVLNDGKVITTLSIDDDETNPPQK